MENDIRQHVRNKVKIKHIHDTLWQLHCNKREMMIIWNTAYYKNEISHPDKKMIIRDEFTKMLNERFGGFYICYSEYYNNVINSKTWCVKTDKKLW